IVQETLTNVARHAGVRQVVVRTWADSSTLGVQIEDHGSGFDRPASQGAIRVAWPGCTSGPGSWAVGSALTRHREPRRASPHNCRCAGSQKGVRTPVTILLADDHLIVRQGLRALLERQEELHVVAETGNGLDAIRL